MLIYFRKEEGLSSCRKHAANCLHTKGDMGRKRNYTVLFFYVIICSGSCNLFTQSREQSYSADTDTGASKIISPAHSGIPVTRDTATLHSDLSANADLKRTDEKSTPIVRTLSGEDKRYIDWIIPDYPDVVLWHEHSAETMSYTEEIRRYLRSKHASVTKKTIIKRHEDKARDKRLYIEDVGENWYEVYVFDEWK